MTLTGRRPTPRCRRLRCRSNTVRQIQNSPPLDEKARCDVGGLENRKSRCLDPLRTQQGNRLILPQRQPISFGGVVNRSMKQFEARLCRSHRQGGSHQAHGRAGAPVHCLWSIGQRAREPQILHARSLYRRSLPGDRRGLSGQPIRCPSRAWPAPEGDWVGLQQPYTSTSKVGAAGRCNAPQKLCINPAVTPVATSLFCPP